MAQGHPHGADFMNRLMMIAPGHMNDGNSHGLEALGELDGLLYGMAVRLVVGSAEPHTDRIIRSYLAFDLLRNLQEKTYPVFQGTSIPVGSFVRARGEEVGDEIAMACMDFDHIEFGELNPFCRYSK